MLMKNKILTSALALALLSLGATAFAQEAPAPETTPAPTKSATKARTVIVTKSGDGVEKEVRDMKLPAGERKARAVFIGRDDAASGETEKVTYLGVETASVPRALAAQLGLGRDMGLVVMSVAAKSPASAVLQEHDVLKQLDDQILIDTRQLSALVRSKKPGDTAKLTIIRGGKEQVVTAQLAEHELPKRVSAHTIDLQNAPGFQFFSHDGAQMGERLPEMAREEVKDVLRVIGGERGAWVGGPRVHVVKRSSKGESTIHNLAEGNFVFSDESGSVEVTASKGDRKLVVKDEQGKVIFNGPINTDEERAKLSPEIKSRLEKLDAVTIDFETDGAMERAGAVIAPPAPKSY